LEPTRYKVTGNWMHKEGKRVDSVSAGSLISTILQRAAHRYVTYGLLTKY
jgi:hypothetical protein